MEAYPVRGGMREREQWSEQPSSGATNTCLSQMDYCKTVDRGEYWNHE